jgi:transcriptional regulator with XRE-family HTH domain
MTRRPQSEAQRKANVALGRRMALLRKERGFTQVELAEHLGVIQSVISSYEVGRVRPSPEMVLRISSALRVSADQLLGREDKEPKSKAAESVDRRFLRRLKLVKTLPKRDQDALLRTIDAFLTARDTR